MRFGTEYRAVWSLDDDLDAHQRSRCAAAYLERVDDAVHALGVDHGDETLAEVHDRNGLAEDWHDEERIEHDAYDDMVLDDYDVRYTLEEGGFVHLEYEPDAVGGDFRLRASGGPRLRGALHHELGRELETTWIGTIREFLSR